MNDYQLAGISLAAWCVVAVVVAALVCTVICRIKKKGRRR